MANYTPSETTSINAAWRAVRELCSRTNWSDGPAWRNAEKIERREFQGTAQPGIGARAMICKAWLEGLEGPDVPARKLYWIRPGYLSALMLGVRHAVEQQGTDYNGPAAMEAAGLCREAVAAIDAHSRRIVEG